MILRDATICGEGYEIKKYCSYSDETISNGKLWFWIYGMIPQKRVEIFKIESRIDFHKMATKWIYNDPFETRLSPIESWDIQLSNGSGLAYGR